uniref:Dolichyl-diphosphooligosaccharide--protein glycosyltransferase subunit 1 n=1 Tax=Romanomermis culicivorax TaxID=13658 RepID=A0A915KHW5_ROMCU
NIGSGSKILRISGPVLGPKYREYRVRVQQNNRILDPLKAMHSSIVIGYLSFSLLLYVVIADDVKSIIVTNVDRELDISTQIVRETLRYEIENTDKIALNYFVQPLDTGKKSRLSFISASFGQNSRSQETPEITKLSTSGKFDTFYRIKFSEPLGVGNQYVNSLYPVKRQTTAVKLSSGSVESYTKLQPVKQEGNKLIYGPYENTEASKIVSASKINELVIHYENNSPFLTVTNLNRLIEISHWGNIAVEETLDIAHSGAILKGSFSRFDFQRDPRGNDKQPCVKSFKTILPASAKDVYYRDEIGNISTSSLRQKSESTELEIRPRFPLFGGWKTNYYIGYNVPSYEYLFSSGNRFALKMRFIDHIFKNYVVDDMTIKIILPEGARDIEFKAPYSVRRLPDEVHYTYLDFSGRPVIVAQKQNLDENHIKDFEKDMMMESPKTKTSPSMPESKPETVVSKKGGKKL